MEQKKDPAFLFYSKDFLSMIQDLTMEERGQFITLLTIQHQNGHLSEKTIRTSIGILSADVLAKLRQDSGSLWYSDWLENIINERKEFAEKQRDRARKRWEKQAPDTEEQAQAHAETVPVPVPIANVDADENANKGVTESKTPKPRKKKTKTPVEDTVWPTFENFWEAGLAKVGREIAMPRWYNLEQEDKVAIMEFIPKYLRSNDKQYLKRPPSFLNQKTWKDEIIDRNDAQRIAAVATGARKNTNSAAVLDTSREYRSGFG